MVSFLACLSILRSKLTYRPSRFPLTTGQIHGDMVASCLSTFSLLAFFRPHPRPGHRHLLPRRASIFFCLLAWSDVGGVRVSRDVLRFRSSSLPLLHSITFHLASILCRAGHPERNDTIVVFHFDNYEKKETFSGEFAGGATTRARSPHNGIRIGAINLRVLGVA